MKQKSKLLMLASVLIVSTNINAAFGQKAKLHFVAFGDSRGDVTTFGKVMGLIDPKKPELVLFSGDMWDGYTQSQWIAAINAKPNLKALLNANKFLVAWGNHESCSAAQAVTPTILRGGVCNYAYTEGNCFFISMGEDPAQNTTWLETQLKSQAAQDAKWRVIYHHYNIYSAGGHPASGLTSYETLCDKYNVAFSVSGHDHTYQRSKVMFGKAAVFTGKVIPATQKGTTYLVSGGAGAPLYSVSTASWQEKGVSDYNYMEFFAYDDSMRVSVYTGNGALIESFVRGRFDPVVSVDELNKQNAQLLDPKPSVFSTSTTIEYSLDKPEKVEINILDISGRIVKTLINEYRPSGVSNVDWNGDDNSGNIISSGIYFCKMISGEYNITKKLVFTK